jgi:hypothetical protein
VSFWKRKPDRSEDEFQPFFDYMQWEVTEWLDKKDETMTLYELMGTANTTMRMAIDGKTTPISAIQPSVTFAQYRACVVHFLHHLFKPMDMEKEQREARRQVVTSVLEGYARARRDFEGR